MTTDPEQRKIETARYVEDQLAKVHAALTEACRLIKQLPAHILRKIIAAADLGMKDEAGWEGHEDQRYLTPRYFTLSSETHAMRNRLADRLAKLEAKA